MTRVIRKGKNLAGTCGIPAMGERLYVSVLYDRGVEGRGLMPRRITLPDGRSWEVGSILSRREFGREIFGNLVICFEVGLRRGSMTVWYDDTGWFVRPEAQSSARPD